MDYTSPRVAESDTSERLSLHYTPWQGGCPGGHSTTLNNTGTSVLLELGVQQETASKQVTQVTIWLQWGQHQSRVGCHVRISRWKQESGLPWGSEDRVRL